MSEFRTIMLAMQVGSSLLLIALSIPLILGKIGPNGLYGFRVRRTMDDPKVWYPANAFAGKALLRAAIVMIVANLILSVIPVLDNASYAFGCVGIALVSLGVSVILCFRYLGQLTRATKA